jgi:hypothetical protein
MQDARLADGDLACKRPAVMAALRFVAFAVPGFTLGACALAVNGLNESGDGFADATAWDGPAIDEDGASSQQGVASSANRGSDSGSAITSGSAGDGSISVLGPSGSSAAPDSGSSDDDSSNGGSSSGPGGDGNGNSPSNGHGPGNSNGSGKGDTDASRRVVQDSSMR